MCEEQILSKVQDFVKSRMIEGFDWDDFRSFLKGEQPPPSQTFEVSVDVWYDIKTSLDTWTIENFSLTTGKYGSFEEFPCWMNYHIFMGAHTSRCYFRDDPKGWLKMIVFFNAKGQFVSAQLRQSIHSLFEKDLRQKILSFWEDLIWENQLSASRNY